MDNAAGTGGFLVAAMGEMMNDAGDNEKDLDSIREKLYGIEYESSNLALLVSNMIIHSDGRSNIFGEIHLKWYQKRLKKKVN